MGKVNLLPLNGVMPEYQDGSITMTTSTSNLFTTIAVSADEWLEEIRSGYQRDPYFAEVLIFLKDQMPYRS